ncbi:MAG: glycosyltransferase family 4 protein [Chitinophagaceae bacterium]
MQKRRSILFLTLKIFSATGGIEKICRIAGKALYELGETDVRIFSMHDDKKAADIRYFPAPVFKGFNGQKLKFTYSGIKEGIKNDIIILSHINLLTVGYIIKLFSPKKKLLLFAHGIEVWKALPRWKKRMLKKCDRILAVSNFTKEKLRSVNNIDNKNCVVLNNCIDPFLAEQSNTAGRSVLQKKYGFTSDNFILITVTRILSDEQYKGHDKIIESIGNIIKQFPYIRYVIAGKYDLSEKIRLDNIIAKYNLQHAVVFTGFVADEELPTHYGLADVFIMPSYGEGFGIAFIEAMYYGLPVIAGNKDGSVDALCNGDLGVLVDPLNVQEISAAIIKVIANKNSFIPDHNVLMENFGYAGYKSRLRNAIEFTLCHN